MLFLSLKRVIFVLCGFFVVLCLAAGDQFLPAVGCCVVYLLVYGWFWLITVCRLWFVRVSTFITVPQFGTVVMRLATISKGRWVGGARTYSIWACALRSAACGVSSLMRGLFAVHGEVLSEVPTSFSVPRLGHTVSARCVCSWWSFMVSELDSVACGVLKRGPDSSALDSYALGIWPSRKRTYQNSKISKFHQFGDFRKW